MSASELGARRRCGPVALVAVALLIGCEEGPPPELGDEVATLRQIMEDDPAAASIEEAERVAVNGLGRPRNTPSPRCRIGEVRPCMSRLARTTRPP